MGDFNPQFSFDIRDESVPKQTPWDFSDALKGAVESTGTSIDYKIRAQKTARTARRNRDTGEEEVSSEEELLPGEEDLEEAESDEPGDEEPSSDDGDDDEPSSDGGHPVEPEQSTKAHSTSERDIRKGKTSEEKQGYFGSAPKNTKFSASSFGDLNLSRPLIRACSALGYSKPTPIQAACIPLALTGRDICGSAITGSGKTAAFSLPLLERLLYRDKRVSATYVLILVPARELAVQVHSMIERLAQFTDIRAALVVGGLSVNAQAAALRTGPEIVVGTPGRVIDHLRNSQGFGLEDIATLVLDEADRLLEMGFKEEIHEIVKMAPEKRQTLLFSATMTEQVKDLIKLSLRHPVRLAADETSAAPKALTQEVLRLKGKASVKKEATLLALVARGFRTSGRAIIFFSTKQKAHRAKILFGLADLPLAVELHGDMTQAARLQSLEDFRTGKAGFLLATDVAARGLDILGVETVINFDAPRNLTGYLHRIGRTARAGTSGRSITFIEDGDRSLLKEVIKKGKIELLSRKVPPAAINAWQTKLESFERDVIQILKSEREEKELRKAEMEAQKATNMIDHRDEIFSRPARTWFQTKGEKMAVASEAKKAALGLLEESSAGKEDSKGAKAAAKSKKRLEKKQAAKEAEEREKKSGKSDALQEETKEMAKRVRQLKAKEQELRESGISAAKAGRIAAASLSAGTKKKKRKRDLFSDGSEPVLAERTNSKVYPGGAKTSQPSNTSRDQIQLQLVSSISDIGQGSWNACLEPGANPFLSYEFLHALEESKSACARTGWLPQHVLITAQGDSSEALAVCPMYLKGHSYGEYVFDSGWAQSYDYNVPTGPRYYPKLQCCVPFTPVEGNRILLNNNHSRGLLQEDLFVSIADTMMTLPERMGVSSVHVTFNSKEESDAMARRGWIQRTGVQYHFQNRGYDNFDDFLMNLKQKKRKSIRQERKRVQNNVVVKQLTGDDLNARVWDSFYSFYLSTVDKRWGTAYLTREFFDMIGESMRDRILLVCAYENQTDETPIAAALNLIGNDTLFGRNWGCLPGLHIHGLHFELCYYQAIDFAIRNGLTTVQAGAQGEHKIQRGYLPSTTYSNHYVANAQFAHAVKDFCQRESRELEAYSEALQVHESPYK